MLITNKVTWAMFLRQRTKVKLFLYLPWRRKSGVEIYLHSFLISCLEHSTPRGRTPGTNWIGGWVGTRAGLNILENGSLVPAGIQTSRQPARSVVCTLDMLSELHKGQETVVRAVLWTMCHYDVNGIGRILRSLRYFMHKNVVFIKK